jgi:hypothetical protein
VFFDVCAAIGWETRGCGVLAWERAYVLNDRYMCSNPCGRSHGGTGWHYCSYWSCVSWGFLTVGCLALFHKETPKPNWTLGNCNSVNFTILNALRLRTVM